MGDGGEQGGLCPVPFRELLGPDGLRPGPATLLQHREVGGVRGQQTLVGRLQGSAPQHQQQTRTDLPRASVAVDGRVTQTATVSGRAALDQGRARHPEHLTGLAQQLDPVVPGVQQAVGQHGQGVGVRRARTASAVRRADRSTTLATAMPTSTKTTIANAFSGSAMDRVRVGGTNRKFKARLPSKAASTAGQSPPTRAVTTTIVSISSDSVGRPCRAGVR